MTTSHVRIDFGFFTLYYLILEIMSSFCILCHFLSQIQKDESDFFLFPVEDVVAMTVKDIGKQFRQVSDLLAQVVERLLAGLQAFVLSVIGIWIQK